MKYIRTENGVFKKQEGVSYCLFGKTIAEADTIEELCDRFVYNRIGEYEVYRNIETDFKENDINYIKRGGSITGAIWTSKGLIYVAKMNDKGDLELI